MSKHETWGKSLGLGLLDAAKTITNTLFSPPLSEPITEVPIYNYYEVLKNALESLLDQSQGESK